MTQGDRVDTVDRVDTAAKNLHRPKSKPPGKIEKFVSRSRALSADRAGHVHPVHPVHPRRCDRPGKQLTANQPRGEE